MNTIAIAFAVALVSAELAAVLVGTWAYSAGIADGKAELLDLLAEQQLREAGEPVSAGEIRA